MSERRPVTLEDIEEQLDYHRLKLIAAHTGEMAVQAARDIDQLLDVYTVVANTVEGTCEDVI